MSAEKLPEFGTGLRAALERRGSLGVRTAPPSMLRLLVREQPAEREPALLTTARLAPAA